MNSLLLFSLIVCSLSFNLRSTKQIYDSYVMAVQWANGYCTANDCKGRDAVIPKNTLTIHGLWPTLKSGVYLDYCTTGIKIIETNSSLFENMRIYWPSFSGENNVFWEHEYNKHGYCMVEEFNWDNYTIYFQHVMDLFLKSYKSLITNAFPGKTSNISVTYYEMKTAIRNIIPNATFNMKCTKGYISEFYFYLERDYSPSTSTKFNNGCSWGILILK